MKIEKLFVSLTVLLIFANSAAAKDIAENRYSIISTSFYLSKTVDSDKVKADFKVYAEGDNYNMALRRLTKINNNFLFFLKNLFPKQDIQTKDAYGYSKTAVVFVSIDSKKINKIASVLRYIANKNFQYKTGIKPINIRFIVSDRLKQAVKAVLFKKALNKAKMKLIVVNKILGGGYLISNLQIRFNPMYPVSYTMANSAKTLYRAGLARSNNQNMQLSPGTAKIKVNVELQMSRKMQEK
ncbi:MAG: SIMPL domain-containing protein [Epsilonproteobacteria bacterium]|nr:SIMPL domain-containing protein [Campylobacterota bacterium]